MITTKDMVQKDFLGKFIHSKLGLSPYLVAIIVVLFNIVWLSISGLYFEKINTEQFIRLTDQEGLIEAIVSFIILSPVLWWFYSWQYSSVPDLYSSLGNNKIIMEPVENGKWDNLDEYLNEKLLKPIHSLRLHILVLVIIILGEIFYTNYEFQQSVPKWFVISRVYYFLLYFPPNVITAYVGIIAILRHIVIIKVINDTFGDFNINIWPLHYDQSGGLGSLGRFSMTIGVLALAVGVWVNMKVFLPSFYGKPPEIDVYTISIYIFYVIIGTVLILTPIIGARKSMLYSKHRELSVVTDEFNRVFYKSQLEIKNVESDVILKSQSDLLVELRQRFDLIEASYPTWPFSTYQFRRISISGLIPVIPGIVLSFIEIYQNITSS